MLIEQIIKFEWNDSRPPGRICTGPVSKGGGGAEGAGNLILSNDF